MNKSRKNSEIFSQWLNTVNDNCSFFLNHCFNLTVHPSWKITPRKIENLHLLVVLQGTGLYTVNGNNIKLKPGTIIFIGNDTEYIAEQDPNTNLTIIAIRFTLYNSVNRKIIQLPESCFLTTTSASTPGVIPLVKTLDRHFLNLPDKEKQPVIIHSLLYSTMLLLNENEREFQQHSNIPAHLIQSISEVKRIIENSASGRHSLGELAKRVNMTPKHMSDTFTRAYGISPKNYEIQCRMSHACYLLKECKFTVKQVASELSYPDQFIFSKQFKKYFGYAPANIKRH